LQGAGQEYQPGGVGIYLVDMNFELVMTLSMKKLLLLVTSVFFITSCGGGGGGGSSPAPAPTPTSATANLTLNNAKGYVGGTVINPVKTIMRLFKGALKRKKRIVSYLNLISKSSGLSFFVPDKTNSTPSSLGETPLNNL